MDIPLNEKEVTYMWEIWQPYVVGMAMGFLLAILINEAILVIRDFLKERKG